MPRKPLTKWGNATFLSSSNQVVILSLLDLFLFFLSLMSSITPINFSLLYTSISLSFWVIRSITPTNFYFLEKRMKKRNNILDCLQRLKKEWRKETTNLIDGAGRVGTRGRVRMRWVIKNCDFRQKHFRILENIRRHTLLSSKTGVPGGALVVRGG
jgi:hypothetical protein